MILVNINNLTIVESVIDRVSVREEIGFGFVKLDVKLAEIMSELLDLL
jgi:hypothetical protein